MNVQGCFLICFLLVSVTILMIQIFRQDLFVHTYSSEKSDPHHHDRRVGSHNKTFQILWYHKHPYFKDSADLSACPYSNCIVTNKNTLLNASDAVLFGYDPKNTKKPRKKNGQIWIIVHVESPVNNRKLHKIWNNEFDWSMTYRRDSEIFLNFLVRKRNATVKKDYQILFDEKNNSVAWAVSNCFSRSKRNSYVRELKKYIDVDVYGRCGNKKCPGNTPSNCHEYLSKKYKFYLAFENSLCKDYVTEKIFHNFLNSSNAVYVYRGAPNVKSILPERTYINTRDFKTPKDLANHLTSLGSNRQEYTNYLKESDKYYIEKGQNFYRAMCQVCELLNTKSTRKLRSTGRNFNKWYKDGVCEKVTDISH